MGALCLSCSDHPSEPASPVRRAMMVVAMVRRVTRCADISDIRGNISKQFTPYSLICNLAATRAAAGNRTFDNGARRIRTSETGIQANR